MDLTNPLATVSPTLDAGVLQVLAATTAGCATGEMHRRLGGGSDEGVRRVLARLVTQGVVVVDAPGRYRVYLLNREHVAARHTEALTRVPGRDGREDPRRPGRLERRPDACPALRAVRAG